MRKRLPRFLWLLTVPLVAIASVSAVTAQAANADTAFVSTGTTPTAQPWLGFGTNEYPQDRDSSGNDTPWTSSDFATTTSRLDFVRPALTRINVYLNWFNPSGDLSTYDWGSTKMQALYKVLDYYNSRGFKVQIGIWHDVLHGPPDDPNVYTSTAWADAQAAFMSQLLNGRHYTNIYGYAGINEWNCSYMYPPTNGFSFSQWQTATRNLSSAFASYGVPTNLIVGPDSCRDSSVMTQAAQNDAGYLKAYEDHYYPTESQVAGDQVESTYSSLVSSVDSADSGRKPVYISEIGVSDPDYTPTPPIDSYAYGLDMFDYGVQIARSGAAGGLAWCLDGFDVQKNCGMWDISGNNGGTTLRPWFYTWSLLSRYFPAGASMYTMPQPSGVRIVAARIPTGSTSSHWSFALLNRNATTSAVTLQVPGWGGGDFDEYVYSQSGRTVDGNGFPTPYQQLWTANAGLQAGLTVTVPAGGAVVLTTMNRSPVPEVTQAPVGHAIALQASNGHVVSAWQSDANTPLEARSDHVQAWETFDLVDAGGGYVALRAHTNNLYVSAWLSDPNTPLEARSSHVQAWEEYQLVYNSDGTVSFKSQANGDYVSAWQGDPNTPLEARSTRIAGWEEFTLSVLS